MVNRTLSQLKFTNKPQQIDMDMSTTNMLACGNNRHIIPTIKSPSICNFLIHTSTENEMSSIDKQFEKAVELVKSLPSDGEDKPTQEEQLEFYGLYKQATVGDVNTSRPGMMDFTGKYKWDAWKGKEGMKAEEAKTKYVELLKSKLEKIPNKEQAKKVLEQLEAA
ncbi:hypothetical protein PCASD_23068 [Puccinia coronata f. sp. avenae]|uniref:ACB domain-containing protein n=1 Tax=Puccinia coronata f. sp. avenae TaxID=200324 RepID=A0A2N5S6D6_9BASI|nr:hypothetical protein PCASD_23068 [Puccinia coronata f. sp. avenae]